MPQIPTPRRKRYADRSKQQHIVSRKLRRNPTNQPKRNLPREHNRADLVGDRRVSLLRPHRTSVFAGHALCSSPIISSDSG